MNYSLGYYTVFEIKSKTNNHIDITVNTPVSITNDVIEKVVDEFNFIGLPYIYQSKLITVPENSDVQIMIKHYDSLIIPYNQSINLARDEFIDTLPLV
ncbi:MAG: hypothetical protein ABIK19_05065, partial [candidate division WOR-3 bacterium]